MQEKNSFFRFNHTSAFRVSREDNSTRNIFCTSVRYIKGVGPKRAQEFSGAGIHTIEDLLYYFPFRYENRSNSVRISDLKAGFSYVVGGDVIKIFLRRSKSGIMMFEATISDGIRSIDAVWFNQPYLKDYIRPGLKIRLYGKVERYQKLQIISPEYEIIDLKKKPEASSLNMGRIVPIYPLSGDFTQKYLRKIIFETINRYIHDIIERLPEKVIKDEGLADIRYALNNIHFPSGSEALSAAYKRLVFDEFFILQSALAIRKKRVKSGSSGYSHALGPELMEQFNKSLPFELTPAQKSAIKDIERDMASSLPMNRLLEGDVGSGKTVVASYALMLTVKNSMQGCIMAPTETLARQHFISLGSVLMPLGVNIELIVGAMNDNEKHRIQSDINSGKVDILVGTHAIIQNNVIFKNLGLVVIDEQHKFGVTQRALLKSKGCNPHVLMMTATPIPRTLALTIYGDLDISVIKEMPKGRKPVLTYWVEEDKRGRVYDFLKNEIDKGRQAFIVCPRVDVTEIAQSGRCPGKSSENLFDMPVKDAVRSFNELSSGAFQNYRIGLLHGRMNSADKESVMMDFKKGILKILVSTVVIEVGIDVPNATIMVIENADMFGLSQLHQLRGRIGRGEHESYCILLANPKTNSAIERLKTIENTIDGFEIAEVDLGLRGAGEILGTRQHGLPEVKFGDIVKDFSIMDAARRRAFHLIDSDPYLARECHNSFKKMLIRRFRDNIVFKHIV